MIWLHHVPFFVPWLWRDLIWHKDRSQQKIYITFDDGPIPGITDFVLRELERRGMFATFFMVGGNVSKHPSLAREVALAGHCIGNHTYNHMNGASTSHQEYVDNVKKCQDVISETVGISPESFRPPFGRIRRSQRQELGLDFDIVMWDVLTGDFDKGLDPRTCLRQSCRYTRNGSIVLFHDQEKTVRMVRQVLPDYLAWVADQGFETGLL